MNYINTRIKDTCTITARKSIVCSKLIRRVNYSVENHLTFVDFLVLCLLMPLLCFEVIFLCYLNTCSRFEN